ncbi:MAG: Hsp70 family protein, partial [Myxococcales bacterium]|nr:Hsp70 family protein [Myxococcales bacterium]
EIYLAVPASFDAAARTLTVRAAEAAGLAGARLIEEPQAAFYAWIATTRGGWRRAVRVGDVVLVCDVGGGTTDLTLVAVGEEHGSLTLERRAVGDHILLGGDNMDLALAHALRERLRAEGRALDAWQMRQLVLACQAAKERLLGEQPPESITVAIAGRGSQLVGGSIGVPLSRDEAERILIEGFLPHCEPDARPQRRARAALTELGLPYASDPAITRQLAAFLARHAEATGARELARPTAILFNGGVWRSARLRERLLEVVGQWMKRLGAPTPRVLHGADLDLGCARGAAAYAAFRLRRGVRIRGGTARAFYVGVEAAVPAVPGLPPPVRAHCIAPFGMEEGSSAPPLPLELGLVVGEPVQFRFFSSSVRRDDVVGDVVERVEELDELPPIEATVPTEAGAEGDVVPVRLVASVTEVGVLRVEAVSRDGAHRHRVELDAREGRS